MAVDDGMNNFMLPANRFQLVVLIENQVFHDEPPFVDARRSKVTAPLDWVKLNSSSWYKSYRLLSPVKSIVCCPAAFTVLTEFKPNMTGAVASPSAIASGLSLSCRATDCVNGLSCDSVALVIVV